MTGAGLAPADAHGAILNVTATDARAPGFVTVWPAAADGSCDPAARPGHVERERGRRRSGRQPGDGAPRRRPGLHLRLQRHQRGRRPRRLVRGRQGHAARPDARSGCSTPATAPAARPARSPPTPPSPSISAPARRGAALNVTAVLPRAKGFLTVWPARADGTCAAADRPLASNLNYGAGQVVANLAVTAANASGRICVYSFAAHPHRRRPRRHASVTVRAVRPAHVASRARRGRSRRRGRRPPAWPPPARPARRSPGQPMTGARSAGRHRAPAAAPSTSRPRPWRSEPSNGDCPPLTWAEPTAGSGVGVPAAAPPAPRRQRAAVARRRTGPAPLRAEVHDRLVPRPRLARRRERHRPPPAPPSAVSRRPPTRARMRATLVSTTAASAS